MNRISSKNLSRTAVITAFFICGALLATWVSRIPAIQAKFSLSEGELGLLLLAPAAGVLAALPFASGLIARFGSRTITVAGAITLCLLIPLTALAPHPLVLWLVLFLFGGAMSTTDMARNEQAILVERNAKRPLMSSFHASFSIGALAGALTGAGMASIPAITTLLHFIIVAITAFVAILFARPHLLQDEHKAQPKTATFRFPTRALWPLGAVAFSCAIAEGAMSDWSAVYLAGTIKTTASFAALGYAAFSLTMTAGRLLGDRLSTLWSPTFLVRAGGLIAMMGFLAAILTTESWVVLIGFAIVGIGLANIIPLTFSAAGNYPGNTPSASIASVATIGYAGFLAGPPLIGFIAEATSLRIAFVLITLLVGSLVFTGKSVAVP